MILVYIINGKPVNFGVYIFEIRSLPSCNINNVTDSSKKAEKLLTHRSLKYNIMSVITGIAT